MMPLDFDDVLPVGPYAGQTVRAVLQCDPGELTEYNELVPKYDITPEVLHAAYSAAQDQLSWQEFINLWEKI